MYMRKIINGAIVLIVTLFAQQNVKAQGTITYLSNLGQPSSGSDTIGSDSWVAARFFTGNNGSGYILNSVQLAMADASGSPSGFTVMLYTMSLIKIAPQNSIGTLTGSDNPSTAGIYTYTDDSNIILSPGTTYFIVLTAGTTIANGAYEWSLAGANSYNPSGGWAGDGGFVDTSSNGSSWNESTVAFPQFAINATAIPEPSSSFLLLFGSGVFIYVRRAFHR
jgi:PEP-CTERM motif